MNLFKQIVSAIGPPDGAPVVDISYSAKSSPDEGGSISRQQRRVEAAIIAEVDHKLVAQFADENMSGWTGNRGRGLAQAWELAEQLAAAGYRAELWVYHTTRLARGEGKQPGDPFHLSEYYSKANRAGFRLRSVMNDHALQSYAAAGQQGDSDTAESNTRSQWTRDGQEDRVVEHHLPAGGRARYGYTTYKRAWAIADLEKERGHALTADERQDVRGRLDLNPEEAPWVRTIFEWRGLERYSLGDIQTALHARSVKSPEGEDWWGVGTISDLLSCRVYLGEVKYRGEWQPGDHEPLVEPGLFDAVQRRRREKSPNAGAPSKTFFLLRRLLYCARCGQVMDTHSGHDTYHCRKRKGDPNRCPMPELKRELVDPAVLAFFGRVAFSADQTFDTWMSAQRAGIAATEDSIQAAGKERAELEVERAELVRLRSLYRRDKEAAEQQGFDLDEWADFRARYRTEAPALDAQIAQGQHHVEDLESSANDAALEAKLLERLEALRAAVRDGVGAHEDQKVLRRAIQGIFTSFTAWDLSLCGLPPAWAVVWDCQARQFLDYELNPDLTSHVKAPWGELRDAEKVGLDLRDKVAIADDGLLRKSFGNRS